MIKRYHFLHTLVHVLTYPRVSLCLLPEGFTQRSAAKLTALRNQDILSWMSFCTHNKRHLITSRIFFTKRFLIWLIKFSAFIKMCTLKSSNPTLSRGKVVGQLHCVRTLHQYTVWSNLLPIKLQLNVMSSSQDSVCSLHYKIYFCFKPL